MFRNPMGIVGKQMEKIVPYKKNEYVNPKDIR